MRPGAPTPTGRDRERAGYGSRETTRPRDARLVDVAPSAETAGSTARPWSASGHGTTRSQSPTSAARERSGRSRISTSRASARLDCQRLGHAERRSEDKPHATSPSAPLTDGCSVSLPARVRLRARHRARARRAVRASRRRAVLAPPDLDARVSRRRRVRWIGRRPETREEAGRLHRGWRGFGERGRLDRQLESR